MAKRLVDLFGSSVKLITVYKDSALTEDELFQELEKCMFAITLERQKSVVVNQKPYTVARCSRKYLRKV